MMFSSYSFLCVTIFACCYGQRENKIEALKDNDLMKSSIIQSIIKDLQEQKQMLNVQQKTITKLAENLESQAAALVKKDRTITDLQTDIERLKATGDRTEVITSEHHTEIGALRSEIEKKEQIHASFMIKQVKENEQLKATLADIDKEVNELQKYKYDKHVEIAPNDISVADVSASQIYSEGQHQLLQRSTNAGVVAFHARAEGETISHLGVAQTIVFETELLDIGGGYHSATGIFTAPKSGLYLFSVSICSWCDQKPEFNAVLVKNGVWSAAILGHGGANVHQLDQGSVTVAMQLSIGDDVWVRNSHTADTKIAGWGYTTFTGVLISDM